MHLLFRLTHFQKMCAEIFVSMATFSPTFCLGPEAISSLARRATQKDAGRRSCGGSFPSLSWKMARQHVSAVRSGVLRQVGSTSGIYLLKCDAIILMHLSFVSMR